MFSARLAEVNYTKLLGASVLGDSLSALRHSMFGKFSWKEKTHSSLNLTRSDRRPEKGKYLNISRYYTFSITCPNYLLL